MQARRGHGATLSTVAACALAAAGLPWLFEPLPAHLDGLRLLANGLPFLVIWLAWLLLLRRPLSALFVTALIAALLFALNAVKLYQLELPLLPADTTALAQLWRSPSLYLRYLDWRWAVFPLLALALAIALYRWEPARLAHGGLARAALALLVGGLLLGQPLNWSPWRQVYDPARLALPFWTPRTAAAEAGTAALFMYLAQNTRSELPAVDRAAIAELRERFPPSPPLLADNSDALPDVIVVQSESFFDPGDLVGMDSRQWLPQLHALRQRHSHGRLSVPAFGGLTTRTEFEFLTGYPLQSAPLVTYPYTGLVHRPRFGLAWVMRDWAYRSTAIHAYDTHFYRRDCVYPLLGFQQFIGIESFRGSDYHGHYVADRALNRQIRAALQAPGRDFLFAVSIENHGPWDDARGIDDADLPALPSGVALAAAAQLPLRRYLHHLQRADRALGELAAWVMARRQPTLLLFYGDHLPNLVEAFAQWPFVDGLPANQQRVPWLLLDNRGARAEQIDLDASQLAALLLDRAGIGDRTFAMIESLRRAGAKVPAQQRLHWQSHWVAERLRQPADRDPAGWREAAVAEVRDWGPRSAEQSLTAASLAVWVQAEQTLEATTYLSIGGHRLDAVEAADGLRVAALDPTRSAPLLARPGRYPVRLYDRARMQRQRLGEFVVRPRAPRLPAGTGWPANTFCATEAWGPQTTSRRAVANPLPDGSLGLWLKSGCLPGDAVLYADERALPTTLDDGVATAPIDPALLQAARDIEVSLRTERARLPVGVLRVQP